MLVRPSGGVEVGYRLRMYPLDVAAIRMVRTVDLQDWFTRKIPPFPHLGHAFAWGCEEMILRPIRPSIPN